MRRQIEQALENMDSSAGQNREKIKAILRRYVEGEIGLDEAYYELLDNDLIPMPQRCSMHAKLPEDDGTLKEHIKARLCII